MKTLVYTLGLLVFPFIMHAQNCGSTTQKEFLHANNVRATILNGGDNFWDLDNAQFKVPYTGPESPASIFATGLWLAAHDQNGELRMSQVDYRNQRSCGYESGPVFEDSDRPTEVDYRNWDKIFSVHQLDILLHKKDFEDGDIDDPIEAIYGWPGLGNKHFESIHGFPLELSVAGAGFREMPGSINGVYEPELGEFPHIVGMNPDVTPGEIKWCVYNNKSKSSEPTGTEPLGLEIQQTMFAMSCPDEALSNAVFQRYAIINKSGINYSDVKMGQWMDPDLGCYTDDYIGCDPTTNTAYTYNKDDIDGTVDNNCNGGVPSYEHPPVSTVTFLNESLDKYGSYSNSAFGGNPATLDPRTPEEFHNLMNGLWRDGTPWTFGGNGYDPSSTDTVDHLFPDIPTDANGWSMAQSGLDVGDRRFVATTSRQNLADEQVWTIDLVYGYYNDNLSSAWEMVDGALDNVRSLLDSYDSGFTNCRPDQCGCECVWPGDSDRNGRVEYLDFINIVRSLGEQGQERSNGLAWKGYDVQNWSYDIPTGVNSKNADVNGDGQIDLVDLEMIYEYMDRKNTCYKSSTVICPQGDDLIIVPNRRDSLFKSTSFKRIRIDLNSTEEFEGLSYELRYDENLLDLVTHSGQLAFPSNPDQHYLSHTGQSGSEGILRVVQMSSSRADESVSDETISDLFLIGSSQPKKYPTPYTEIKICNAIMHFADGTSKPLKSKSVRYWFDDSVLTSAGDLVNEIEFDIYPNPAAQWVDVNLPDRGWEVTLIDQLGRNLNVIQSNDSVERIDLSSYEAGIYYVRIAKNGLSSCSKLVVLQ